MRSSTSEGPRARDVPAAQAARPRARAARHAAAGVQHAVLQHDPARGAAAVSRQPRDRERHRAIVRWNALAMVVRANREHAELGGHIASYASAADLFEVGFNHFFRGRARQRRSRVLPAARRAGRVRARVPRRAADRRAARPLPARNRRRRACRRTAIRISCRSSGSSRPARWASGPITAIYQARFMRYLENRGHPADRAAARCGRSSATARWTSPSRSPGCRSPRAKGSTT